MAGTRLLLGKSTTTGIVIIVLTVFAMSTADMIVKLFSSSLPLWQIYVVRSLIVIPILGAFAIFWREAIRITPVSQGWVAVRSLLLAFMYIFIYADYAYLGFASFWSFAVFHEAPDLPTIIGLVMIAAAGLMVVGRQPKAPGQVAKAQVA